MLAKLGQPEHDFTTLPFLPKEQRNKILHGNKKGSKVLDAAASTTYRRPSTSQQPTAQVHGRSELLNFTCSSKERQRNERPLVGVPFE